MTKTLTIGDRSKDGLLEITDTRWDGNGTMYVTVREMIGGMDGWALPERLVISRMRTLARRAIHHPHTTQSSAVVARFDSGGCSHVTFAVSRLPR